MPRHLIHLDLTILIILGGALKLCSLSLFSKALETSRKSLHRGLDLFLYHQYPFEGQSSYAEVSRNNSLGSGGIVKQFLVYTSWQGLVRLLGWGCGPKGMFCEGRQLHRCAKDSHIYHHLGQPSGGTVLLFVYPRQHAYMFLLLKSRARVSYRKGIYKIVKT